MAKLHGRRRLIQIIKDVAAGNYSSEILELTGPQYPAEVQELAEAVGLMMIRIQAREEHLELLTERIKNNSVKTVTSIAHALAARDEYTEGHGERVGLYAMRLARRLELPEAEVERLGIAGTLHDIGKIGFSDRIFSDEDTRDNDELMGEIRNHPRWGYDILKDLDFLGVIPEYVLTHHEHMDGSGYPRGLRGESIPLGGRILAVADHFDAMTTNRPYREKKSPEEALKIMAQLAGQRLDPVLVSWFTEDVRQLGVV